MIINILVKKYLKTINNLIDLVQLDIWCKHPKLQTFVSNYMSDLFKSRF